MKKKLTRSSDERWLAGICGGIAEYTGQDANLIRLLAVVLTLVGVGSVIVIYIVAWFLMPEDDGSGPLVNPSPPQPPTA